jgi:SAM-dependent methyltransferase
MRIDFTRYKKALIISKNINPGSSYIRLLFEKIVKKLRHKYDLIRCVILKDSTFLEADTLYMCSLFPVKIIDRIIQEFHPQTILDVGCGTGISLEYFLQKNIDAIGIENSRLAINKSPVSEKIIRHNLKREMNLKRKFDLVWCFEVIEHIHPRFEPIFLNTLIRHSDRIIISAAIPGQGGHGHFNEQLPEYWVKRFSALRFKLNEDMTECLKNIDEMHAKNMLVFEKEAQV